MSFDDQEYRKKKTLFRQSLRFQETASNVFVQKVPVRYLKRLYNDEEHADDPVVQALRNLDESFAGCKRKAVDMASSVEAIVSEHVESGSKGFALLAWQLKFDAAQRAIGPPSLVGLTTLSSFASTPNFSTDTESLSAGDLTTLRPYMSDRWLYIDALCSTTSGVGRLLVMHAYNLALQQKQDGVIALSFSRRSNAVPESKRIFDTLQFETLIPRANFRVQLYGSWVLKRCSAVDLAGISDASFQVCTRTGFTSRTSDRLMWRC